VLVLTRKTGESIVIGNDVVVTVLEVRSDQVRIGIAAPRSVQVHREEVYRQVERENAAAVASADRARALLQRGGPRPKPGARPLPPQARRSISSAPTDETSPPAES
jgi:carbon storage regulator